MKVSVIISAFNRPKALRCCLASFDCQTFRDFELIVVDNSPTAENWEVAGEFGAAYLNTKMENCYFASEVGVQHSVGEYLCFPNDDNYYVPAFLEYMLKEDPADFIYCNCVYDPRIAKRYHVLNAGPRTNHIDKGGFLLKREVFDRTGGFDRKAMDWYFADGYFIEKQLIPLGTSMAKAEGILFVHN